MMTTNVSEKDSLNFISWVTIFASHGKYETLRKQLLADSSIVKPMRMKSVAMIAELKRVFPDLDCTTDITGMKMLFTGASRYATVDQMKSMMIAINIILALQAPPTIPVRLSSYTQLVIKYRDIVRKSLANTITNGNFLLENRALLIPAGGSSDIGDIKTVKKLIEAAAVKALTNANNNRLVVSEFEILKTIKETGKLDNVIDALVFCQIMTGARKSDLVNPRIASFDAEISSSAGYITQLGASKDKHVEKGISDEILATRRRVEKPILVAKDIHGELITPDTVRTSIKKLREMWGSDQMIEDGMSDERMHAANDKKIADRVRYFFKKAAASAETTRKNGVSSHLLRKIYGNYSYVTLADGNQTLSGWLASIMGWDEESALKTSLHYTDVRIDMTPPVLPAMSAETINTDNIVDQAITAEETERGIRDSIFTSSMIMKRIKNIIALKQARKSSVTIKNNSTGVDVKVHFYRRKHRSDEEMKSDVGDLIKSLKSADVVANNTLLRAFGVGAKLAKKAMET